MAKLFVDLWHSATGTKPKPKSKPPAVKRLDNKRVVMRATVTDAAGKDGGLVVTLADETQPRTWEGEQQYLMMNGFNGRAGNHSIPVVRNGDVKTVRNILGSIRSATVQGPKLVGVLKFVDDADGQTFAKDVRAGVYELRLVVDAFEGYEVKKGEQFGEIQGPAIVVTSWSPLRVDAMNVQREA